MDFQLLSNFGLLFKSFVPPEKSERNRTLLAALQFALDLSIEGRTMDATFHRDFVSNKMQHFVPLQSFYQPNGLV